MFLRTLATSIVGARAFAGRRARAEAPAWPALSAYEAILATELPRLAHPGIAGGIVLRGGGRVSRGAGSRHVYRGGAVDGKTVFRIASISKVFAGVAILTLRDAQILDLNDPITRFLPEAGALLYPNANAPRVTLRHLLTHTSGLPRNVPNGISEAALLQSLMGMRLESVPGSRAAYSNLGVGLVGPMVRRATGQPYRDYLDARVFTPLGMRSVAWDAAQVDAERLASGHVRVTGGDPRSGNSAAGSARIEPAIGEWKMGAAEAFGGLYACVDDLAPFVALELSAWGDAGGIESPVLARSSLRESQTRAASGMPDGGRYGICWSIGDDGGVWHSGATDEYSASVVISPQRGVGAIVLANLADVGSVESLARRILSAALALSYG